MHEQGISWGWVMRILAGILWRWIAADVVATVALAFLAVITSRVTGNRQWEHPPLIAPILIALWAVLLVWALGAALRARHGRYRLALVSAEGDLAAFD